MFEDGNSTLRKYSPTIDGKGDSVSGFEVLCQNMTYSMYYHEFAIPAA